MKAVICGAGIAGLAAAERLAALNWDVVVVEKAPGPRRQGYMIDFFGPGYEAAEAMGVLPRLHELGYQVDEMRYIDEAGRRRAGINHERFSQLVRGELLSIMRPDLELALREKVTGSVDLRFGTGVTAIDEQANGVQVRLTDGTTLDADLLVGADGIHSTVRQLVFGDEARFLRYLGFHTAAYVFADPEIYAEVGNRFCLTDTAGRQMGFYGLRDGTVAVFTVHRTADPTVPTDTRQAVRAAYGDLGWVAPCALALCPEPPEIYYDQVAQIELPQWSSGRVVLLGDACGAVSLLAGQGASLAMGGAYVLAKQLAKAGSIEAALAEYQRLWQPIVTEKQQVARHGVGWFLPSSRFRVRLRRLVLTVASGLGLDRYVGKSLVGTSSASLDELGHEHRELDDATAR
ncbi:MAG: FAD-dependent monooxygenase [Streptosporangiales bacterium]